VIAARAGTVVRLGSGGNAGLSIDLLAVDGLHCDFYAHLDELSPALTEGVPVERGQTLGIVGTTGNAAADAPHLHFAVRRLAPGQSCWEGDPIDPVPLLRHDS
jgi:murein DD-endopeptidase MepM/ murein hydrolase activator NlpD